MSNAAQVLDQIAAALENGPFTVSRNVTLSDGTLAAVAASRTYFSWKGLVICSQHIVIRHVDHATQVDAKALFDAGFRFGKRANRVPLLRGLQFGYMIIPVLVGELPESALVKTVGACPPKRWGLFECPVVVNLTSNEMIYFNGTPFWGALFFADLRNIVKNYMAGSLLNSSYGGDGR